jgi:hypothetical protein
MSHLPPPRVGSPLVTLQDASNILSESAMRDTGYGYTDVWISKPRGEDAESALD